MINEMDDSRKGLDLVAGHWAKTKTPRRAITFLLEYGNICLHSFDCNSATEVFDRIIQVEDHSIFYCPLLFFTFSHFYIFTFFSFFFPSLYLVTIFLLFSHNFCLGVRKVRTIVFRKY